MQYCSTVSCDAIFDITMRFREASGYGGQAVETCPIYVDPLSSSNCTSNTVLVGAALSTGKKHRPVDGKSTEWNIIETSVS